MSKPQVQSAIERRHTRAVRAGGVIIGGGAPIAVQSMCATRTQDTESTLKQILLLKKHGADIIRVAVDSKRDVEALKEIRSRLDSLEQEVNLVVDLQESYRLVEAVAPLVQKIRYNPGHLHHHEKSVAVAEKVSFIVRHAERHGCAVRIGVNFGSLDPEKKGGTDDRLTAALASADEHIALMEGLEFENFVVSLKSSDPNDVIDINTLFAERHPEVPVHLGVTEAGMLPMGEIKTRIAFENLLARGIGDTVRVSLTLPFAEKYEEIVIAKRIIADVGNGRFRSVPRFIQEGLNIISCPSCSRVENEAFVELAAKVKEMASYASGENITIAVMGCRVNGPGETDDADLGLWCAPRHVNLKRKGELLGAFSYEEILPKLRQELDSLISSRTERQSA
ncbi:MAG: (E)-4-hydroxy-3-methylbut-2-enyl-diphosphate synthase [Deltaproteobacteria bacterium]|nr:(E)-4-hydroxy-3-methylbut-2-enyl-diphosphate synthase [Deltaproteobacteria bacterium]